MPDNFGITKEYVCIDIETTKLQLFNRIITKAIPKSRWEVYV